MGVSRDFPKKIWVPPIITGTGKATNFKFGRTIHTVHPNKSPLKILEKRERGHSRDCPNFLCTPIISGTGKATKFQFCRHIYMLNRNESPLRILGKVAVGHPKIFSVPMSRAHRAVSFAIAHLSCCTGNQTLARMGCLAIGEVCLN